MLAGFARFLHQHIERYGCEERFAHATPPSGFNFPQQNPTLHHWSENPASPRAHPSTLVLEEAISQLVRQGLGFALRSRAAHGSNRRLQAGNWPADFEPSESKNKREPMRCQATTVCGSTMTNAECQSRRIRDREAPGERSIAVIFRRLFSGR